jgi:hypothetical protein
MHLRLFAGIDPEPGGIVSVLHHCGYHKWQGTEVENKKIEWIDIQGRLEYICTELSGAFRDERLYISISPGDGVQRWVEQLGLYGIQPKILTPAQMDTGKARFEDSDCDLDAKLQTKPLQALYVAFYLEYEFFYGVTT